MEEMFGGFVMMWWLCSTLTGCFIYGGVLIGVFFSYSR